MSGLSQEYSFVARGLIAQWEVVTITAALIAQDRGPPAPFFGIEVG
jgi:hypothetical protein